MHWSHLTAKPSTRLACDAFIRYIAFPFRSMSSLIWILLPLARKVMAPTAWNRALWKYLEENFCLQPAHGGRSAGFMKFHIFYFRLSARTAMRVPLKGVFYHNAIGRWSRWRLC